MARKLFVILTVVIIAVVAVAAFAVLSGVFGEKPNLMVTSQTLSGKTAGTATLNLEITNLGGDANNIVITVSSPAFQEGTSAKINIPGHQTTQVPCQVVVKDVESKDYPITLTYTEDGIAGSDSGNVAGSAIFHALPSIDIVNLHVENDARWIGANDYTYVYFNLQSNTDFQAENIITYSTFEPSSNLLDARPSELVTSTLAPKASTEQYYVIVESYSPPPGMYTLHLKVTSGDFEITTATTTIEVKG